MPPLRIALVLAIVLGAAACSEPKLGKEDRGAVTKTPTGSLSPPSASVSTRPPDGPAATIHLSNLTFGYADFTPLVTTEPIDPPADTLLLAHVTAFQGPGEPEPPTLSGNDVTWTLVGGNLDGEKRHWVFRGIATSPNEGPVTIDWGGIETETLWVIDAAAGTATGHNGADAIVQFVSQESQLNAGEGAIQLQPFSDPENNAAVCFAFIGSGAAAGIFPADGFVETGEAASKGQDRIISDFWQRGQNTTCAAEFLNDSGTEEVESWLFLAIELQAESA
jgi:hypothetical protein